MSGAICRLCGCTNEDCSGCVERTGEACRWVQPDLCSACTGESLIFHERTRQVEQEGWSAEHDDEHKKCEMRKAAECYALPPVQRVMRSVAISVEVETARGLSDPSSPYKATRKVRVPQLWPWAPEWWKPSSDRVRELVKAGALYRAECTRQLRSGHESTARRMLAKAASCARKIDRITKDKTWLRLLNRVGRQN